MAQETEKTPVEKLQEAGMCDPNKLGENDKKQLNSLDEAEVENLIALHNKLGKPSSDAARPNFPV